MAEASIPTGAAVLAAPVVFAAPLASPFAARAQTCNFATLPPMSADRNVGHAINDRGA